MVLKISHLYPADAQPTRKTIDSIALRNHVYFIFSVCLAKENCCHKNKLSFNSNKFKKKLFLNLKFLIILDSVRNNIYHIYF